MYSGFCVLKGLLETRKRGFYRITLIKNSHYWLRGVNGDSINDYFRSKYIGDVGFIIGEWKETEFDIFVLKEPY